jgi:hypothetical protein
MTGLDQRAGSIEEFKAALIQKGYSDCFQGNTKRIHLPNTTVLTTQFIPAQSRDHAIETAHKLGVKLERAVALREDTWAAIPGTERSD